MPGKCICHIHEMASGGAAETCHLVLRVTEALLSAELAVTLTLSLTRQFVTCCRLSPLA